MKKPAQRIIGALLLVYYGHQIWEARDYFSTPVRLLVAAIVTILVLTAIVALMALVPAMTKHRQRTGSGGIYTFGLAVGIVVFLAVIAWMMR